MTTERYISRYLNLRLVNKSAYNKEIDGRVVTVPGVSVQFSQGIYETSDPVEIEFLDNHPNIKNKVFFKVDKKVKDAVGAQKELAKSLEEKNKELDDKNAEIARLKALVGEKEEGARSNDEDEEDEDEEDGLEDLDRDAIKALADEEEVEYADNAKTTTIIKAIRDKRKGGKQF